MGRNSYKSFRGSTSAAAADPWRYQICFFLDMPDRAEPIR